MPVFYHNVMYRENTEEKDAAFLKLYDGQIEAGRLEKATGVWLEGSTPRARKICAIGVRGSHYVTMHGPVSYTHLDVDKRQIHVSKKKQELDITLREGVERNEVNVVSRRMGTMKLRSSVMNEEMCIRDRQEVHL